MYFELAVRVLFRKCLGDCDALEIQIVGRFLPVVMVHTNKTVSLTHKFFSKPREISVKLVYSAYFTILC